MTSRLDFLSWSSSSIAANALSSAMLLKIEEPVVDEEESEGGRELWDTFCTC